MSVLLRAVVATTRTLFERYHTRFVVAAIAATGCSYHAGSFADRWGPFPGPHVELPCLDLSLALLDRAPAAGSVIQYSFGNRCRNTIIVDLAAVRVTARSTMGEVVTLRPSDPRNEIRPSALDGLLSGREQILYQATNPVTPIAICIDASALDRSSPAQLAPICLATVTP